MRNKNKQKSQKLVNLKSLSYFANALCNTVYTESHILKIWDEFISSKGLGLFTENSEIGSTGVQKLQDSLFEKGTINITAEAGILYKKGNQHSLYTNNKKETVSIASGVNYQSHVKQLVDFNLRTNSLENALLLIKKSGIMDNGLLNHVIVFPYYITQGHFASGVLQIQINHPLECNINLEIYNPLPQITRTTNELEDDIKEIIIKILLPKLNKEDIVFEKVKSQKVQQYDTTSCGVITAENGKDIIDGIQSRIDKTYDSEIIKKIRLQHLNEVHWNKCFMERLWSINIATSSENDPAQTRNYYDIDTFFKLMGEIEDVDIKNRIVSGINEARKLISYGEEIYFNNFITRLTNIENDIKSNRNSRDLSTIKSIISNLQEGYKKDKKECFVFLLKISNQLSMSDPSKKKKIVKVNSAASHFRGPLYGKRRQSFLVKKL